MAKKRKQAASKGLAQLLSRDALRAFAGVRSFDRGIDYFEDGSVGRLAKHEERVTASVQGTQRYTVKLWDDGIQLRHVCTCPVGKDGLFCKHCVAVGLTWLDQHVQDTARHVEYEAAPLSLEDAKRYLSSLGVERLVDMLMEEAMENERCRERLLMRTAAWRSEQAGTSVDTRPFLQAIDNALDMDYVPYREMYDYTQGVSEAVESIGFLLKEGHAERALEVATHALDAVEAAFERVDDSDGSMGGILHEVAELHLAACKKAKPDAEALAEWLFRREMGDDYDVFSGSLAKYGRVLGKKGRERFRALAEEVWARLPALGPGDKDTASWSERYRITALMDALAREDGGLDARIGVKSRDLSSAYRFLEIAELCKEHRKGALALEWAERGLVAFPEHTDSRLREFLATEYHKRKRHDEALALVWKEFEEGPNLDNYKTLNKHATGIKDWPAWREQALNCMRASLARENPSPRKMHGSWIFEADHSLLVEVFLWEKDIESAWREAQAGGCSERLWLDLAEKRGKDHPEDALPIYERQIEPTVMQKNNAAYEEAAKYLRIIRGLMKRQGRSDDFAGYLATIRAAHKPKRNFMKLLDRL